MQLKMWKGWCYVKIAFLLLWHMCHKHRKAICTCKRSEPLTVCVCFWRPGTSLHSPVFWLSNVDIPNIHPADLGNNGTIGLRDVNLGKCLLLFFCPCISMINILMKDVKKAMLYENSLCVFAPHANEVRVCFWFPGTSRILMYDMTLCACGILMRLPVWFTLV